MAYLSILYVLPVDSIVPASQVDDSHVVDQLAAIKWRFLSEFSVKLSNTHKNTEFRVHFDR